MEFLIKDITISLLVMSTFKLFIFFLLCFVIAYIIFQLGVLLAFILNVILSFFNFENIKEHSSLLWIFVASLPSLFFLVYCLQYEDFRSLILLIFFSCTALIFKEINNKFSIEDINVLICLLISCFAIGNYQAKVDSDVTRSKLAKVENYAKNQDWRILTYLNENVILLNLKKVNNKTEFKIVKFENLEFSVDKKSYE